MGNAFRFANAEESCSTVEECKALLEEYEKKIAEYQQSVAQTQAEQDTLNNKIYLLRQKINSLDYQIRRSNIVIGDLTEQVKDTEESIEKSEEEIEKSKERLAEVLRRINEEGQKSTLEIFLANDDLSEFFEDVFALETVLSENREILVQIKEMKVNLEGQKIDLESETEEWQRTKQAQILQKQERESLKQEQEWLLTQTKGEEEEYQRLLAENRKKAQEIRERIFSLVGVSKAPSFGEALEIAKYVESVTGVRPAFLLAILRQESNIGQNVGQCYLKNKETGDGIVIRTGQTQSRVMKPMNIGGRKGDVDDFVTTCSEVGRDPYSTPVSCPYVSNGQIIGYGGAMGPAQFIPTTWATYKHKVKAVTGKPADPWDIKDAFLAAGLLLKDAGATSKEGEWCAAMVYYSGSCNSGHDYYANSVTSIVKQYENDIAQLEKYGSK